jgi:TatD DNase family protein
MIDTHCHLDLYPSPTDVAAKVNRHPVLTISVTNLPSAFARAYPHVRQFSNIRLALGLHPLLASDHATEIPLFRKLLESTSYIGEVGLDFSREGIATQNLQIESFRFVLDSIKTKQKFVTLHSRRAESTVLAMLEKEGLYPVVFHWFSGSMANLKNALAQGHFFSVNPAMTKSRNGQAIIAALPTERVLTETDGPFVQIAGRAAIPPDVALVEEYLAALWKMEKSQVEACIRENFCNLIKPLQ